jgi:hypothetical protein
MPRNPRMDESGPDGYTVILKINSYVNISATSRELVSYVPSSYQLTTGQIGWTVFSPFS